MKKLFCIMLFFLALSTIYIQAVAQNKIDSLRQAQRNRPTMEQYYHNKLGLDSVKTAQIVRIEKGYRTAMVVILRDASLDDPQKKKKMHALRAAKKIKLKAIIGSQEVEKNK